MRLRLRTPSGQFAIQLPDDATILGLLTEIETQTSIQAFDIKFGYPPKQLDLKGLDPLSPISHLNVRLNNETLIITEKPDAISATPAHSNSVKQAVTTEPSKSFSFVHGADQGSVEDKSIIFHKKSMTEEVPELPLADRGATLGSYVFVPLETSLTPIVLRVMPDDNSCLFRAFGTAVLPGDDLSMTELRALVAGAIQADPETYSKVVLEQNPDDYCRWIQTVDAWGGAIEIGILANHFDLEVCSIDVQSLRVDKFNEGRPSRCILVYSGIHYDTIVQSPSEFPHVRADNPPELDKRIWDSDDDEILTHAVKLCRILREKHYYTDTASMSIRCKECQQVFSGESQAQEHASKTGHYDMAEIS